MKRFLYYLLFILCTVSTAHAQIDTNHSSASDVDDFLFDTEGLDDEDADLGGYNPGVMKSADDVFSNNAAVSFNITYFKNRGIESRYHRH